MLLYSHGLLHKGLSHSLSIVLEGRPNSLPAISTIPNAQATISHRIPQGPLIRSLQQIPLLLVFRLIPDKLVVELLLGMFIIFIFVDYLLLILLELVL